MTTHPHHGHGHDHGRRLTSLNRAFVAGIVLNTLFVAAEFTAGLLSDSMGLLSDAGHNLSDVVSLLLALLAFRLAQVPPSHRYTYGYRRSTILVSLLNAVILLVAVGAIVVESVRKLMHPEPVAGGTVLWVAGIGVVINFATALLFLRDKERDLNVKGAYLHMAADALVSVGVMISGAVMMATGWYAIDPLVGCSSRPSSWGRRGGAARQPAALAGRRARRGSITTRCGALWRRRRASAGCTTPRVGAQHDRKCPDGAHCGARFAADAAGETGAPRAAARTGDRPCHAGVRMRGPALRRTCRLPDGVRLSRRRRFAVRIPTR